MPQSKIGTVLLLPTLDKLRYHSTSGERSDQSIAKEKKKKKKEIKKEQISDTNPILKLQLKKKRKNPLLNSLTNPLSTIFVSPINEAQVIHESRGTKNMNDLNKGFGKCNMSHSQKRGCIL